MNADRWHRLQVRHLVALREIAEQGSFARAAGRLGYTQSAISQQIAALEQIAGAPVLERPPGRRPAGLTAAGELLLRHADAMLARVQAAQADLEALTAGTTVLRVGTYQSVGARILPEVIRRFSDTWPNVEIALHERPGDAHLLELVERAELDLTFTMLPALDGPFESLELLRDPYVLVVRTDSPIAGHGAAPTLAEITAFPLIGFRSCRNEQRVEAHLRARGLEPQVVFRTDDNGTLQGLVAAGLGAALVPRLTVDAADPRTMLLDLADSIPPRLLGIAWHRDRHRPPAALAFTDIARDVCAEADSFEPGPHDGRRTRQRERRHAPRCG